MNADINEKQSMAIINEMITTAKQEHHIGGSFYFILWGCIVMLFSLLTYYAVVTQAEWQPLTYSVFAIGGIISMIHSKKDDREEKVRSWYDSLYMYVWIATGICLALTWSSIKVFGVDDVIPISLMFYAMANFITGGVTKFYPSLVGAIICFVCVIVAFNVSFAVQNLVCAFAVCCTHVIPGIMMRKYYAQKG